jgi:hypothetical protein
MIVMYKRLLKKYKINVFKKSCSLNIYSRYKNKGYQVRQVAELEERIELELDNVKGQKILSAHCA